MATGSVRDDGWRLTWAFRQTFDYPLRGPMPLGWFNHFGLGQFVPVEEECAV